MFVPLEIHDADFLLVPAADAAGRGAAIMVAPAGFLADLDQAFLRPGLRNLAEVRIRYVTRGRRQRSKCLHWHKINNVPKSNLESGAINPVPSRESVIGSTGYAVPFAFARAALRRDKPALSSETERGIYQTEF